jgi:hypothetical protein
MWRRGGGVQAKEMAWVSEDRKETQSGFIKMGCRVAVQEHAPHCSSAATCCTGADE